MAKLDCDDEDPEKDKCLAGETCEFDEQCVGIGICEQVPRPQVPRPWLVQGYTPAEYRLDLSAGETKRRYGKGQKERGPTKSGAGARDLYGGTAKWLAIKVPDLAYCNMDQSAWVVEPVEYALHAGDRPVSGMGG